MGSYTFKWEQPADEVFVTGTFDNWTKSEKLDKIGDIFKKTVYFKDASVKIYYKFVVDHAWIINESSPKEADEEGNVNNFLTPEDMASEEPVVPVIATVAAESTTAQLAGEQPIEKNEDAVEKKDKDEPSEVVETTEKNEKTEDDAKDDGAEKKESVATPSDVPGGFPTTPSDDLDKIVSINPLPAADGAVNPIKLAPGEPIPDVFTESVTTHVKLDEASYEKADALPGIETSELQPPSASADVIPESGLSVADEAVVHINTVGSTTLALAAEVPLESKVPEIVKESQEKAGFPPEASAVPEEVREKAEVEKELIEKVPEVPAASESAPAETSETTGVVADGVAAASAEVASEEVPEGRAVPASVEAPVAEPAASEEKPTEAVPEAPAEVKEPTNETEVKPETAASVPAAEDKKDESLESKPVEETKAVAQEENKAEAQEEIKVEEASAAPDAPQVPQVEPQASESTEPAKSEVAGTEKPEPAVPATETPAAASKEPESSGPTQVEEPAAPAEGATAEAAPAAERPREDNHPETPKSEGTEVTPNAEGSQADAEANSTEEKSASPPSDKKKKGFLKALFGRFRSRISGA